MSIDENFTSDSKDVRQQEVELSAALFEAYREWRASKGMPVPEMDKELSKTAYKTAVNCARLGKIEHRTAIPEESSGKLSDLAQYTTWKAEPSDVVERWASSKGHRYQLQCCTAEKAGAGAYRDEAGTWWYAIVYDFDKSNQTTDEITQEFAERATKRVAGSCKYSPTGVF